jgi:hypothetical protein
MKPGFALDVWAITIVGELGKQLEWVEGEAELSPWTTSINLTGKQRRNIVTCCCAGCGYLESYAVDRKS